MGSRLRLAALAAAIGLGGFLIGGGAQVSLALLADQETTASTFSSAACFSDVVPPTVSATVGSKVPQYLPGYIRQGGTYYIYATVTDSGGLCAPSGVSSATANVSSITTGQTAVSLAAGSFSVGGVTYDRGTASITANAALPAGTYTYAITSTDVNTNSQTQAGYTVVVDNTPPAASMVQTANGGATGGKAEIGDTITYTFSEIIDPQSILAGWTGASTNVVLRIAQNAGGDLVTIRNAANAAQLPFGTVNLIEKSYVTTTRDFGATGTPGTMVQSGSTITVTLGTASGATGTEGTANTMSWAPSTTATDRAGNTCLATVAAEPAPLDVEF